VSESFQIDDSSACDVLGCQDDQEEASGRIYDEERLRDGMLETLGRLTQGISRDFQAGLQTILDNALRLKSRVDVTTTALGDLLVIETSARRLLRISGQLSDLARPVCPLEPLDLNGIVRGLLPVVQATRGGRPAFLLELEPSLPTIWAERNLPAQALITLFLRAAREMPHGGTIRVRTGCLGPLEATGAGLSESSGGAVWVAIKDESPGYPCDLREHISQAIKSGKLCGNQEIAFLQTVMYRCQGTLLLDSQVGRGTTWTLYFPAVGEPTEDSTCGDQDIHYRGTILLVDDEPLICGVGRRVLESSGYRVITASNGAQAVELYRIHQKDVNLVLLDVILPDQSGLEVLRSIRRLNGSARVLISSGYTTEGGIRDTLTETGAGFIQKPYRIKELLTKVEKAISIT
jgi:CheY-like chemotaxis protein